MSSGSVFVSVGKEKLHCLKWGSGRRLLLAFHGYGDDATIFTPLREHLAKDFTTLSIDLPHHGNSKWPDKEMLKGNKLAGLVENLKNEYNVDKVSLLGYSLGGRVCLSIVELMPAGIDKVVLLASDGLTVNTYYYFFTKTLIGRKIFRRMLEQPGFYLKTIEWLKKMHLVDGSRYKFAMHFLKEKDSRDFLLKVWPGMSDLIPAPAKLRTVIKKFHIPVSVFMGAYDKIIPPSTAKKFSSGLDSVQVIILEKGHRLFDHENALQIAEHLF